MKQPSDINYRPTIEDGPWVMMACVNHHDLRWTRKNPAVMAGMISRNPQLMFNGSETNRQTFDFDISGTQMGPALRKELEEKGYIFECECPLSCLYYLPASRGEEE